MTAEKSPAGNGANPEILTPNPNQYPARITLSAAAESYLDQLATDLELGHVEIHQMSPALRAFYWFAFFAGRAGHDIDCGTRVSRLEWERDLFYFQMANRGKTAADYYAAITNELWAGADS